MQPPSAFPSAASGRPHDSPPGCIPADADPGAFRLRRGRNWFFLGLTYASYYLCRYNLSPIANELKRSLGLDNTQYGAIATARDAFYAVGQMINGLFTDRLGGKVAMSIGAVGTVAANLAFGFACWSNLGAATLTVLVAIRAVDGYFQAFGAPGMIKINTAWFQRRERGGFAGIFGAMINLGAIGSGELARLLATGASISLGFAVLTLPELDWQFMFIVPPAVTLVMMVLMNLMVAQRPEEAGYTVDHSDEPPDDPNERVSLRAVFVKIASNQTVWIVAGAYFCTGVVRRAIETWYAVYLDDVWHAGRTSDMFRVFAWGLPVTATLGSLASGFVSDKLFHGRRAPVAATLYLAQTVLTILAMLIQHGGEGADRVLASVLVIGISMMCNSTHSILGTAAAMDLGGRKMAGCSSGIIDSFQYYGAIFAGVGMGYLFERLGAPVASAAVASVAAASASASAPHVPLSPIVWFSAMLPFGLIGTGLMTYLWVRHGKSGVAGS